VVLTLLMVLVFLLAAWAVHGDGALGVDRGAKALIRDGRAVALETPMWLVGLLGTGYVLLPVTLVCSAVLWRRGHRLVAVWLPAVGVSAALAIAVVKWLIDKPRPTLRGYGFPSGHVFGVTVFVVLALYLFWSFEASPRWQRAARAAAVAFVAVVATVATLVAAERWFAAQGRAALSRELENAGRAYESVFRERLARRAAEAHVISDEPRLKALLGIPPHVAVAAVMPLGRPAKPLSTLRRKPVAEFAVAGRWGGPPLGPRG